jgi:Carboxypeptidase Taq (M32) metallopeptidase
MPSGGAAARSMQKSALAGVIYEKRTAPVLGELLQQLQQAQASSNFTREQLAVIRDAKRDFQLETRKTKDMASREAEIEGRAYHAWYVYTVYTVYCVYVCLYVYLYACNECVVHTYRCTCSHLFKSHTLLYHKA